MTELQKKVNKSIERLKAFEPPEGYYLAFSGGKDSVVCKALLDMSGCKYDATYRVTSVDPPELVRFIKDVHPDVIREVPRYADGKPITMWNLIPKKLHPPTRAVRYCCDKLKESGGSGRMTVTGVRWAESKNRRERQGEVVIIGKKDLPKENEQNFKILEKNRGSLVLMNDNDESRKLVEQCYKKHKTTVNPIIDWEDNDVWQFIKGEGISYCELYDEGFKRLGCVGCPLAQKKAREREFNRWAKYKNSYLTAFDKMIQARKQRGKTSDMWQTARDVFNWWMEYDVLPGQIDWFEDFEEDGD